MRTILLLLCITFIIFAKIPQNTPIIKAIKIDGFVNIDGKDDESFWNMIPPITEFYQRVPDEGRKVSYPTEVKICYDSENIYVFAKLYFDTTYEFEQRLTRRDDYTMTDWFYFFVDPNYDKRNGYGFAVNPNAVKVDFILFNDSWDDSSWDAVWEAQTAIEKNFWTVEMKIPMSQIRFQNKDVMDWGINFKRTIIKRNEEAYFVMVPKNEAGFVSKFAKYEGVQGIKYKDSYEIWPYFVIKNQLLNWEKNDPFRAKNEIKTQFGLDFKKSITNSLNLNLTVYPDFGQVEADPASVNLSVFETYYNEKRPFFVEGSDIFSFGAFGTNNNWNFNWFEPELFYSRRIGRQPQLKTTRDYDYSNVPQQTNILLAAKISGKISNDFSLGILNAITEKTYGEYEYQNQKFKEVIEPLTNYSIVRGLKEFNDGNAGVGVMWTSTNRKLNYDNQKNQLSSSSNVIGIDNWFSIDNENNYVIKSYFAVSNIQGTKDYLISLQKRSSRYLQNPDNKYTKLDSNLSSMTGILSRIMLNKQSGNFYINAAIGIVSPTFEVNDLGYLNSVDKINTHLVTGYRWYNPDGIFRSKSVYNVFSISKNFSGYTTSKFVGLFTNFQFMNYYGGGVEFFYGFGGNYDTKLTRGGPNVKTVSGYNTNFNWYSDSRNKFIFSNGFGLNRGADGTNGYNVWIDSDWRINKHLTTSIMPSFSYSYNKNQWVDKFNENNLPLTYNVKYIYGEIKNTDFSTTFRLDYFFTSNITLQLYLRPYFSTGKYDNYHYLINPHKGYYAYYNKNQISKIGKNVIINDNSNQYEFENPDFKYLSLRGNLVFRWEYLPGSTLFLIWSMNNDYNTEYTGIVPTQDIKEILKRKADNIFQLKINYWFNS
jgi:hypothetical protein